MPYKMICRILAPSKNLWPVHIKCYIASYIVTEMVKDKHVDTLYWGNPNRQIGQVVQTEYELLYDYVKFIPHSLQHLWHKIFSHRTEECGVYIETDTEKVTNHGK